MLIIEEEYVSPIVLPNEPLFGWIKWNDDADIDRVVLRCEADVEVKALFDVDASIDVNSPIITIPTNMLTAGGFFGFAASYSALPESKRQISFEVDLVKGEEVKTITLSSCITKPEINLVTPHDGIIIDNFSPQSSLVFDIVTGKETPALNPKLSIRITGTNMRLIKNETTESSDNANSFYSQPTVVQDITIKGQGTGYVVVTMDYSDVIGNNYHEILQHIPLMVKSTDPGMISIAENVSQRELLYIT